MPVKMKRKDFKILWWDPDHGEVMKLVEAGLIEDFGIDIELNTSENWFDYPDTGLLTLVQGISAIMLHFPIERTNWTELSEFLLKIKCLVSIKIIAFCEEGVEKSVRRIFPDTVDYFINYKWSKLYDEMLGKPLLNIIDKETAAGR